MTCIIVLHIYMSQNSVYKCPCNYTINSTDILNSRKYINHTKLTIYSFLTWMSISHYQLQTSINLFCFFTIQAQKRINIIRKLTATSIVQLLLTSVRTRYFIELIRKIHVLFTKLKKRAKCEVKFFLTTKLFELSIKMRMNRK